MSEQKQVTELDLKRETDRRRVPVDCYSRVVGYLRPVSWWNAGKKQEWADRKTYSVGKAVKRAKEAE